MVLGRDMVLVQLFSERQPPSSEPLAVEALAAAVQAVLPDIGVRQRCVGTRPDLMSTESLVDEISRNRTLLLGVSVPQGCLSTALELARKLSERWEALDRPEVVWGHALPTYMPERFTDALPGSVVVRGWGEDEFQKIALRIFGASGPVSLLPGAVEKREEALSVVPVGLPIRGSVGGFLPRLESSRGCCYGRCSFCTRPPGPKNAWREVPNDLVLTGAEALFEAGVRFFTFTDEDLFGDDPDRLISLAQGLREWPGLEWSASFRVADVLDVGGKGCSAGRLRLLEGLQEGGLRKVFLGAESFSDSQLRRYAKGVTPSANLSAIALLVDVLGLDVEIGFMPFDPLVTLEELLENLTRLEQAGLSGLVCNPVGRVRLQLGASLMKNRRVAACISGFDAETMSYLWRFQDSRVAPIYARAHAEWSAIRGSYMTLRSEDRARAGTSAGDSLALVAMRTTAIQDLLAEVSP